MEPKPIIHVSRNMSSTAEYFYLPSSENREQAFVLLRLEYQGGLGHRIVYMVPNPHPGGNHFDLVRRKNNLGLRPWKAGGSDSDAKIIWPQMDFVEPVQWHSNIYVRQTHESVMGLGSIPVIQIFDQYHNLLIEWSVGRKYLKIYGNSDVIFSNGLEGEEAIEAMIEGLQLALQRIKDLKVL